jgi:hypothetical protein
MRKPNSIGIKDLAKSILREKGERKKSKTNTQKDLTIYLLKIKAMS